jgi:hypothetical protein
MAVNPRKFAPPVAIVDALVQFARIPVLGAAHLPSGSSTPNFDPPFAIELEWSMVTVNVP